MTVRLTADMAKSINASILGGQCLILDAGKLDGALARPFQSVMGSDAYPSLHLKAAALLDSLARAHAFVDGNKRTAVSSCATFLDINGLTVAFDNETAGPLVLDLVEHRVTLEEAAEWLLLHS